MVDYEKIFLPKHKEEEKNNASMIIKKVGIFNEDSDEEVDMRNKESPFKLINGKLKGIHID